MVQQQQQQLIPHTVSTTRTSSLSSTVSATSEAPQVVHTVQESKIRPSTPLRIFFLVFCTLLILAACGCTLAGTIINGGRSSMDYLISVTYEPFWPVRESREENMNAKRYLGCWIALTVVQFALLFVLIVYPILYAYHSCYSTNLHVSSQQRPGVLDMSIRELLIIRFVRVVVGPLRRWMAVPLLLLFAAYHVACVIVVSYAMGRLTTALIQESIVLIIGALLGLCAIVMFLILVVSERDSNEKTPMFNALVEDTPIQTQVSATTHTTQEFIHAENMVDPQQNHHHQTLYPPTAMPPNHPAYYVPVEDSSSKGSITAPIQSYTMP